MLRPVIYRTSEGSSGEKIVKMISQKLNRISHNLHFSLDGDVITVTSTAEPIGLKEYFYPLTKKREIKELIRMV